jgi:23S rRNA (uracil1939-C5)-methyltransferase
VKSSITPERFELRVEKIVAGGDGLGRHEGKVVFVPGAAPQELILVETREDRKDYRRATIVEIVEGSPHRRVAPCPFYASCGGCSLMHLDYEHQIDLKQQILLESLRRGGRYEYDEELTRTTGPELGYRARARFHVRQSRKRSVVGFLERGSHQIVDISQCLLLSPEANRTLGEIRAWIRRRDQRTRIISFEIMESIQDPPEENAGGKGRPLVHFVVHRGRAPARTELEELTKAAELCGVVVTEVKRQEWCRRVGDAKLIHSVGGTRLQARVGSFFQVNRFLLEALVGEGVRSTKRNDSTRVGDLYCGVGLFALSWARSAGAVVGVESSHSAIIDAKANLRYLGMDNVELHQASAGDYARHLGLDGFGTVLADPPRGGLEAPVLEALEDCIPEEIRYVSCDPAALGRDTGRLVRAGYRLERLAWFDLFPNTHHFESVATFCRG